MAIIISKLKNKLIDSIPLLIIFYLCLTQFGNDFKNLNFLTFNLQYIIVYYWTLRKPQLLGYGYIFIAGVINDVIIGMPIGISSLTYLIVASFASYIRVVTVRISLLSDWVAFVPAIFVANLFYIIVIFLFGEISLDYMRLLINTTFTLSLYPILWFLFNNFRKIILS